MTFKIKRPIKLLIGNLALGLLAMSIAACAAKKPKDAAPELIEPAPPVVVEKPAPAKKAAVNVRLRAGAPSKYVVKKNDTLWDIAKMYLHQPWLWPELWYFNPQVKDPHLIFPGDVLYLSYIDGKAHLSTELDPSGLANIGGDIIGSGVKKLQPQIYRQPIETAIPTIPYDAIRPFLQSSRIFTNEEFKNLPMIVGTLDNRMMAGPGTHFYVKDITNAQKVNYDVVRKGRTFRHHKTGKVLGIEAVQIGQASLAKIGDKQQRGLSTFIMGDAIREAFKYDVLVDPFKGDIKANMIPSSPKEEVNGAVIALHNAISNVATNQVVIIDLGEKDGLEVGNILSIDQKGAMVREKLPGEMRSRNIQLPDVFSGLGLVFRVFDNVSYMLIVDSTRSIRVGDFVRNPEMSKDI